MRLNNLTKPFALLALIAYASGTCTYQGAYDSSYDLAIWQSTDCTGKGESYTLDDNCGQSGTVHYSGHSIELGSQCHFEFFTANGEDIDFKYSEVGMDTVAYGNIGAEISYFTYACPCKINHACCVV